jgi:hypothetical protein
MDNFAAVPTAWLNKLIGAADAAAKQYCKRDLELAAYVEYYNGTNQVELVLNQRPVWCGVTVVTASSNGVALPTATINVATTTNFPPGTFTSPTALPPTLSVQTSPSTWTTVTYTGLTATSFTGCSGGTGNLFTGGTVGMPAVFWDPNGQYGFAPNAFAPNTQLVLGNQYAPTLDSGGVKSNRGTLRRIAGGTGAGFIGFYPENFYSGKLGAYRMPVWPQGFGTFKAAYTAGYYPVPADLEYAVSMLAAQMVRIMPNGANMSSESLGGYSYSVLNKSEDPELGEVRRTLARYREASFGGR